MWNENGGVLVYIFFIMQGQGEPFVSEFVLQAGPQIPQYLGKVCSMQLSRGSRILIDTATTNLDWGILTLRIRSSSMSSLTRFLTLRQILRQKA